MTTTTLGNCPSCGVPEGAHHRPECRNRVVLVRPCCRTPLWMERRSPHESWCEWEKGMSRIVAAERESARFDPDPWWDMPRV